MSAPRPPARLTEGSGHPPDGWVSDAENQPDRLLDLLQTACQQIVRWGRVIQGVVVTASLRGGPVTLAHAPTWARALQDNEYRRGDGPGLRALKTGRAITIARDQLIDEWPELCETTMDVSVRSIHSEPFAITGAPGGAITLYSTSFDSVDPPMGRLVPLRDLMAGALTTYCATRPGEDHGARLQQELHARQKDFHAVGTLMARHGVTEDRARLLHGRATDATGSDHAGGAGDRRGSPRSAP